MKKVLFLIPNLAHGGAEKVLVNLVNNIDTEKFDVTVQTLFNVGVNRQYLKPNIRYIPGFKYQFRGNSHLQKLIPAKLLYKMLIKEEYDIVVSYLEGVTARVVSGCKDSNIKKVCWIHTEFISNKNATIGFKSLNEAKKAYASFNAIVGVSARTVDAFEKFYEGKNNHFVLYNTNETEQIFIKANEQFNNNQFIEDEIPSLCSVGKIISVKGFDRLLSAHKRLIDEGVKHRVYILGIGEKEAELRNAIDEYGVKDSFILLGYQDNPYKYVSKCDLYVCSSYREGFSTAVTEALIVGTAVVSTDCSGAKELLGANNEYGIVVENSEDGIYNGMKQMLTNPELLKNYKKQAKIRGQYFSREKTVKAVEEMFENLL